MEISKLEENGSSYILIVDQVYKFHCPLEVHCETDDGLIIEMIYACWHEYHKVLVYNNSFRKPIMVNSKQEIDMIKEAIVEWLSE